LEYRGYRKQASACALGSRNILAIIDALKAKQDRAGVAIDDVALDKALRAALVNPSAKTRRGATATQLAASLFPQTAG
jgi:hypothetical protein